MSGRIFTVAEIGHIKDMTKNFGFCDQTHNFIYTTLYGEKLGEELLPTEDWEDSEEKNNGMSCGDYCVMKVSEQLDLNGCCFVTVSNSSGEDRTFIHLFVLFSTGSEVYRIESYAQSKGPVYYTRIVGHCNYKTELAKLMNYEPGPNRILYWNELFSCNETCDTSFTMDMTILEAHK